MEASIKRIRLFFVLCMIFVTSTYCGEEKSNLKEEVKKLLSTVPVDFGGGCSCAKATYIAQLITNENLQVTLDIGVYRGRSFFPQAFAHAHYTGGIAYGVDPYSNIEAFQYDQHKCKQAVLNEFATNTDFEALYRYVLSFLTTHDLNQHAQLLRMRSDHAAKYFHDINVKFDLIHIDGNHDAACVVKDVQLYLELLRPGGYLIMDDVSWTSVQPAIEIVKQEAEEITVRQNRYDDYIVLRKYMRKH